MQMSLEVRDVESAALGSSDVPFEELNDSVDWCSLFLS
jgi:hypothetical protein